MAHFIGTALAVVLLFLAAVADAIAAPGELDTRFGEDGLASTELIDGGFAATRTRGGRIIVAGGIGRPGVARFLPSGSIDPAFGTDGVAASEMPGVQPFGIRRGFDALRVAAVGAGGDRPPVAMLSFALDGRPFGVRPNAAPLEGPVAGAVQRADGGAYVATSRGLLRAIRPDGATDTAFAGGTIDLAELLGVDNAVVSAIYVSEFGGVTVAGTFFQTDVPGALVALLQFNQYDGSLDPNFGEEGIVRLPFAPGIVRVLRGGDLAVVDAAGRRTLRLRRTGTARARFGVRGAARLPGGTNRVARDLVEGRGGRLYLLVDSGPGGAMVAAFRRDGRPLRRFGRRGIAALPTDAGPMSDLTLDRDALLVVGTRLTSADAAPQLGVWRYER